MILLFLLLFRTSTTKQQQQPQHWQLAVSDLTFQLRDEVQKGKDQLLQILHEYLQIRDKKISVSQLFNMGNGKHYIVNTL